MRGVVKASNTLLVVTLIVGAVGSASIFVQLGAWFVAVLATFMQFICLMQWWSSHREGEAAARTADRFLGLIVVTVFIFYFYLSALTP